MTDTDYYYLALDQYRQSTGDFREIAELPVPVLSKLSQDAHKLKKDAGDLD